LLKKKEGTFEELWRTYVHLLDRRQDRHNQTVNVCNGCGGGGSILLATVRNKENLIAVFADYKREKNPGKIVTKTTSL
jgi:hypothetical protein